MRNFEVLGCGAHMISDKGIYPNHFVPGKHFSTYDSIKDCINKVKSLVGNDTFRIEVANEGNEMIKKNFSKDVQWSEFKRIVSTL
jgi:spore maturation protein CgeB